MEINVVLALLFAAMCWLSYRKDHFQDQSDGESVLTERARLHAKSEHSVMRGCRAYYLHFYIPERDTVVVCKVNVSIWKYLQKGDWGALCHQGGTFFSFQRGDELIEDKIYGDSPFI